MKIMLINPPRYKGLPVIREERCEIIEGTSLLTPYSLLQVAAQIRTKGREVRLIDANGFNNSFADLEKSMKDFDYDVLIFRFTPTSYFEDIKTAEISKRLHPKALTIGISFALFPLGDLVLKEAESLDIFVGKEFDTVVPDIIDNIKGLGKVRGITFRNKGKVTVNPPAIADVDYENMPLPAFDLLPSLDPYFISVNHGKPFSIIYSSKGCPYNCMYCNAGNTKVKLKSVERIMKEIDYLKKTYGIRTLSFFDETLTLDKKRVYELCDRLAPYNIKWYCNTRTSLVDLDLLKAMRRGGCRAVSYGIESGSQRILDNVGKAVKVKQHEDAIRWAAEAGIKTHCSFIFGLPGETKETIQETLDFIKRTIPNSFEFNIATPYPGTRLFDYFKDKGILPKRYDWHMLFQDLALYENRELSNEYIEKVRKQAYRSLHFNPRWYFKNMRYLMGNPDDFTLAYRFMIKTLKDMFINDYEVVKEKK
jgi:anaerobic magnesium-protoporphyrin IX monomethyl ester cyclase